MKTKHAITILVFGYCLDFIAMLSKILHTPWANLLFIFSTILKVFGGLLLLYKILNHPKIKNFLDF